MAYVSLQKIIESRKNISSLLNQKLTQNISELIILSSIREKDIKNFICEVLLTYKKRNFREYYISLNPNMTEDILNKYHELYYSGILRNPETTLDDIERFLSEKKELDWNEISLNPNITMEFIIKHKKENWNWHRISRNPNITPEFINKYPEFPWKPRSFGSNPSVSLEYIEKHISGFSHDPTCYWDWQYVSSNPNLTMEFINKHSDKDWNWYDIFANLKITKDAIEHSDIELNFTALSLNPNMTMEIIEEQMKNHPEIKLCYHNISDNPNVTLEFYERYKNNCDAPRDMWNLYSLSRNLYANTSGKIYKEIKNILF